MPKANPRSKKLEIGIRELREITIWPLSMADEVEFAEKVMGIFEGYQEILKPKVQPLPEIPEDDGHLVGVLEELESGSDDEDSIEVQVAAHIIKAIKENLIDLLKYVCDEEVTLADIDNEQFVELVDIIFEMNYAGSVGKAKLLLVKVKGLFTKEQKEHKPSPQKKPSPNSSSTPVTDTNTSTDSDIVKED